MCLRQAAPPAALAGALIHDPGRLAALCAALCQCSAFEKSSAGLLLFAVPEGSAYVPTARKTLGPDRARAGDPSTASQAQAAVAGTMHGTPAAQEPEARAEYSAAGASQAAADVAPSETGQDAEPGQEQGSASVGPPAVLLPRMPMGLALAADPRTYQALAGVARGMGRMAAAAGARHSPVFCCI